jgi:hypothetical protein
VETVSMSPSRDNCGIRLSPGTAFIMGTQGRPLHLSGRWWRDGRLVRFRVLEERSISGDRIRHLTPAVDVAGRLEGSTIRMALDRPTDSIHFAFFQVVYARSP